ncbi:hypothetical protein [Coleofasciculus sp.]|uniref:hypothetical protein n=1 Tax=Coleofasciculus sp. TaxID=3100458 RepID=UPI003A18AD70
MFDQADGLVSGLKYRLGGLETLPLVWHISSFYLIAYSIFYRTRGAISGKISKLPANYALVINSREINFRLKAKVS